MTWLAVAVAGALGAVCRYLLDHVLSARTSGRLPWGTMVVNVSGSLLAGALAGLASGAVVPDPLYVVVAGGFLGAYTTFSTAMYETLRLLEDGARLGAVTNLLGPAALATAAATAGWLLAA